LKPDRARLVLDATPLIHLAKAGLLEAALGSFEVIMAEGVLEEVTRGEAHPDAVIIRGAADEGRIKAQRPRDGGVVRALMRHREIHGGEAETMALAAELGAAAVMDNGVARAVARLHGVPTRPGTLYLLFRLVSLGMLSSADAEERLGRMVKSGLYLDSRTLIAAREKLRAPRAT
jgi:predicted nucleic acid-binding protein